jgi:regulator of telomere elongation helicase 1
MNSVQGRYNYAGNELKDIEELVQYGQEVQACPYYMARDSQASAEIIFIPYNYIVDPASRKSQNIQLENSIIIFDEAHNLV